MNVSYIKWSLLVLFLTVVTFGGHGFLLIVTGFVFGSISVITSLFVVSEKWTEDYWNRASISRLPLPSNGIRCVKDVFFIPKPVAKSDKRLTGSSIIDEQLHQVLQLIMRDYVLNWYQKIADDECFPNSLQDSAQQIVVTLANRAKEVDWVSFCTIDLVDDFASHFRLFREALHRLNQRKKSDPKTTANLSSVFFELEMESRNGNRFGEICSSLEKEKDYLYDVVEVLLYLLLPAEDFNNKPLRYLARDLLVNVIFVPTFNLFSDPDYINQIIIWLCREVPVTSESFLTVIRLTNCVEELTSAGEKVNHEIAVQRSRDSGGEDDAMIKQQLNSLLFVKRVVDHRLQRLQEGVDTDSSGLPARFDWKRVLSSGYKLCSLPLDAILKHNVALSYFIDFMICTGHQPYMFFYLTVEGYRVSAEQQISQVHLEKRNEDQTSLNSLRQAALNIYDQYLSLKATPRIKVDEPLIKKLYNKIVSEQPSELWFDEIQSKVLEILSEDRFYGSFLKSPQYIKMLAELDLLKDTSKSEDDDLFTWEDGGPSTGASLGSDTFSTTSSQEDIKGHRRSHSTASKSEGSGGPSDGPVVLNSLDEDSFTLKAKIVGTGLIREAMKPYVVYAVEVIKNPIPGKEATAKGGIKEEKWQVYRRYSDFHDFHTGVIEKFPNLIGHNFPGKKAFNNTNPEFLDKRMKQLNDYLIFILKPEVCRQFPGLQTAAVQFLEPIPYSNKKGHFAKKMGRSVVNPLRESVRNVGSMVKSMPDNVINTVDILMGGLSRALHGKEFGENNIGYLSLKMTAGIDMENDEDIPLRILLVLADEIFDLKSRNQWLRRRIVVLLREFIKTMYGDRINRKIVDYVAWLTSSEQIAEYVKTFRNALWPNGLCAPTSPERDEGVKFRSRVAAKMLMFCFIPDEMKHIIGSETTRKGIQLVFELFQQQTLNRRLIYHLFERVLLLIFPHFNIPDILKRLHSTTDTVQTPSDVVDNNS